MEKKLLIIVFAVASLHGNAQNIAGTYMPRANDEVKRQEVKLEEQGAWSKGQEQNMVWDFSKLEMADGSSTADYADEKAYEGLLVGTEFCTRHYLEPRRDSLLIYGYENNLMKVSYDRPELLLHLPLTYGEKHSGALQGTLDYCETMLFRLTGDYETEVDATGVMVLPSGDTLRHVSRVHLTERIALHYIHADDSLQTDMQKSPLQVTDTYRWYAAGYRYPILETTTQGLLDIKPQARRTLYCPPEEQRTFYDEENEQLRRALAELDGQGGGDNGASTASPMSQCDISVSGDVITVDFNLTESATVRALVCNTQGMLFRQQSQICTAGIGQLTISCTGLRPGEYILYLNVNGQMKSRKVNI